MGGSVFVEKRERENKNTQLVCMRLTLIGHTMAYVITNTVNGLNENI